jgi:uncharacterized membrane protein YkoI
MDQHRPSCEHFPPAASCERVIQFRFSRHAHLSPVHAGIAARLQTHKEKHMKRVLAMAFIGFAIAAPAPIALADDDDDYHEHRRNYRVSQTEAKYIAHDYGLAWFKEIKRGNGNWEIEGCTGDGQEIEIDISGRTGEIVKLEYEDDDKCWD